jgi:hypothetical protein
MRVWTFETFVDESPADCPYGARVVREGGVYTVTVSGLGTTTPMLGRVMDTEGVHTLTWGELEDGEVVGVSVREEQRRSKPRTTSVDAEEAFVSGDGSDRSLVGATVDLPGARRRTSSMWQRVRDRGWVVVSFEMDGAPMDISLRGEPDSSQRTLVRLLVPIEDVTTTEEGS